MPAFCRLILPALALAVGVYGMTLPVRASGSDAAPAAKSTPTSLLVQAVRDDENPAALSALLRQGADVNAAGAGGWTALMWAAQNGNLATVRFLLDKGARVNIGHARFPVLPLTLATAYRHPDVVRLLLERGADVDARSKPGTTALFLACSRGQTSTVRSLLARGLSPNTRGTLTGRTPLMWAAYARSLPTFDLLLGAGADPQARDSGGDPVLSYALMFDNPGMVDQLLARRVEVNPRPGDSVPPIQFAVGHVALLQHLVAHGADVNARTDGGTTPLMGAILHYVEAGGSDESVRFLLAHGADVNAVMGNGSTALSFATRFHLTKIVALLHAAGAKDPSPAR